MSKAEYQDTVKNKVRLYMDTFIRGGGIDLSDILKVDSIQLSAWSGEYKMLFEELDNYSRNGYSCVISAARTKRQRYLRRICTIKATRLIMPKTRRNSTSAELR